MKTPVKTIVFVLLSSAMAFGETPAQLGAWSIYPASGNHAGNRVVLLQSVSERSTDAQGNQVEAKLDVICKKGKLSAIAIEPNVEVQEMAMSFSGVVPTTAVSFTFDGDANQSEKWAVLDNGRTLSPYSETSQGKLNRRWVTRIAGLKTVAFQMDGIAGEVAQSTFATEQLSEALSSVGCSY